MSRPDITNIVISKEIHTAFFGITGLEKIRQFLEISNE